MDNIRKRRLRVKRGMTKCSEAMLRDKWGAPKNIPWNGMMKEQYEKYEKELKELDVKLEIIMKQEQNEI